MNNPWPYVAPGIPDGEFMRGSVPMTKQEVRILTLAKAKLGLHHTIWDIGAGTGSISIEAALMSKAGQVYAIERNPEGIALIEQNRQKFGVTNLSTIVGEAPQVLKDLPRPDRVILGGTGGNLASILEYICVVLPLDGVIVCNSILLETASEFLEFFAQRDEYYTETVQIGVTKVEPVGGRSMLKAQNPIFIQVAQRRR